MTDRPRVATCLWFEERAEEAARFYVSLLPGSRITGELRPRPDEPPLLVEFELGGTPYQALNGGGRVRLSEAVSIAVTTADQAETDRLWEALVAGGEPSRGGWLIDRWGLSWQLLPEAVLRMLASSDRAAAARAGAALGRMGRPAIAELEAAFRGEG